ncbi:unnamed protein product [Vitrella brassicaformis CCMP3155]|uniref:Uncharacterized protein n=1 Tax=Vitrella brassicaformis (strain CCMP3155) TaxID=1169540 RepID=A0A0G4ET91_VITBC|nr:unnamed protein product [Vitrella brassicaformis CCMP3155]|eukprot:CEM01813.1 unnamed protein product [Vitrella brassicaformis CCMP3155]
MKELDRPVTLHTDGSGWNKKAKQVSITAFDLFGAWDDEDGNEANCGDFKVFFETQKGKLGTWDVEKHGLIYNDNRFLKELKAFVTKLMGSAAANDIDYSESGMQGDEFVSLDAGKDFIKAYQKWEAGEAASKTTGT